MVLDVIAHQATHEKQQADGYADKDFVEFEFASEIDRRKEFLFLNPGNEVVYGNEEHDRLSNEFIENQRSWMIARRTSKKKILEEGGTHAKLHSPDDITRIDFALKRIDEMQYGICCGCGLPISEERLKIVPEFVFCIVCADGE